MTALNEKISGLIAQALAAQRLDDLRAQWRASHVGPMPQSFVDFENAQRDYFVLEAAGEDASEALVAMRDTWTAFKPVLDAERDARRAKSNG